MILVNFFAYSLLSSGNKFLIPVGKKIFLYEIIVA